MTTHQRSQRAVSLLAAAIWARFNSDFGVHNQLELGDNLPLPVTAPKLPLGVSHVWVAGSLRNQRTLAWFPDRGWWLTPWRWPQEDPIVLAD
jgi:hypothetical protein